MPEEMLFVHEGEVVRDVEAAEYPVLAAGLVAANVTHVFETQEAFEDWARSTHHAETIASVDNKIREAKRYQRTDTSHIRTRKQKIVERIGEDMGELARRTGLHPASEDLFRKATIESDVLEGPIFDPITVFDGVGSGGWLQGQGDWLHLPGGAWPDLRWFGWNDRISSLRVVGLTVLYEHIWWGGRRVWLSGLPIVQFHSNLAVYGFDNTASSAWVA